MIGIIVLGHGNMASGVYSAFDVIAGNCDHLETVDFTINDTVSDLENKILKAIDNLNDCDGILCMCDILEGSPYKSALKISLQYPKKNIKVIAGTNMAMIIEASMARAFIEDADNLADMIVHTGKDQIFKYKD